jgi:hypothetical protein
LTRVYFKDDEAQALATSLSVNSALRYLSISFDGPLAEGVAVLSKAIAHNTSLVALRITAGFHNCSEPIKLALSPVLQENVSLQCLEILELHLSWFEAVLNALSHNSNSSLKSIKLQERLTSRQGPASSSGRLDAVKSHAQACAALARVLCANPYLTHVEMSCLDWEATEDPDYVASVRSGALEVSSALLQCPRYHPLDLQCFQGGILAEAVGLPREDAYGVVRSDHDVAARMHKAHIARIVAFAMGLHPSLGGASRVQALTGDLVAVVALCYFSLPIDYFDRQPSPTEVFPAFEELVQGSMT